ncbi:DNA mismatch repair protein MutS [Hydrogenivirga sp. 128-5-R1-1]|uniref:DNA mismatch repair protein MutS n=1 Tax=Hydrogenivirga sp. 128-5-R1-1 TaxID=392423 RepID=UPI00015F2779|nr:DNA mismatch repair protein MutS [Hydrogenivirga sp. 128-5-R1-1]EDP74326.1 DNA mismatch repair protein [Hydrogenivirga sp. 128-5-R1-1]
MAQKETPMVAQYNKIKAKYPEELLLYRLGDFYELFYEDAHIGARELNIALTKKKVGKDKYIPMCGIPYHSADSYITRLVAKGYKVAICEQLEDASTAKGIVKRDVIRVITPGTFFENEKLKSALMAVDKIRNRYAVSYLDLSTGDFIGTLLNKDELLSFIGKFQPKEILIRPEFDKSVIEENFKHIFFSTIPDDFFESENELYSYFKVLDFQSFGFTKKEEPVIKPVSAVFKYAKHTQKSFLPFIKKPSPYREDIYMRLDYSAQKHLELVHSNEGNVALFNVINKTLTGMGKRKLRFFLLHPLKNKEKIIERQNAVEELIKKSELRNQLREILKDIFDIERLVSKISSNTLNPRDMVALRESLKKSQNLKSYENKVNSTYLKSIFSQIEDFEYLVDKLDRYLEDNPPIHLKEGKLIKKGINPYLDELKEIKEKGNKWVKEFQEKERQATGIASLKVGFNKVMGYYIEITKPNLKFVPPHYKRRQTLSNAERFTTEELQSFEEKILSADEKIKALEYEIFMNLREEVSLISDIIAKTASAIGELDAVLSLAQLAVEKGWIKPEIIEGKELYIEEGVHPVIANYNPDFVPNSLKMDENSYFHIITGPNMAGKSTFIRQSAILVILSHIGSFIPARKAVIPVFDGVFTRIGSADALAKGLSTFMVEMLEMSNIVSNATKNSFVVLDEVGRGTSTYDGLSLAWAISEYLVKNVKAKTLFATHYHELTQLEEELPQVKNYHMHIYEEGDKDIKFTYRVLEGFTNKSYGIHVAKLAGIKDEIIERAYEILEKFENSHELEDIFQVENKEFPKVLRQPKQEYKPEEELPIFKQLQTIEQENAYKEIIEQLKSLDIANLTPLQALNILNEIKSKLK